jgi:hypothetical protein
MYFTGIYRIFHPTNIEYTFFSVHGTFSEINVLGHKTKPNK